MPESTLPTDRPLKVRPSINPNINMEDPLALQVLWKELQAAASKEPLEADEVALMVDVTRRLRRTNTGPAKPRSSSRRSSKGPAVDIKSLLMGD